MEKIQKLVAHKDFIEYLKRTEESEKNRIYCKHNMEHFLSVARIGHILNLESGSAFNKDLIYGAALLHDIGRFEEYETGVPHEKASAKLAAPLLKDSGFNHLECGQIIDAILNHRNSGTDAGRLAYILYRADKLSRGCSFCAASGSCKWTDDKKNLTIEY